LGGNTWNSCGAADREVDPGGRTKLPAFKPMARPILFQFLLVAGLLLMISTGARCQVYVDPIFTPANMNGNGSSFVSLPGFEEYTWKGWCRIYTDPCSPRVKLENMLEGTFFNSSSPGDPPSKVTWSMEGHAHVGPCSNPGGHWQQNKSMPGDERLGFASHPTFAFLTVL